MNSNAGTPPPNRKRRLFQFRLRTLFVVVTLAALTCAILRPAPSDAIPWFLAAIGCVCAAVAAGKAVGAAQGERRWWKLPAMLVTVVATCATPWLLILGGIVWAGDWLESQHFLPSLEAPVSHQRLPTAPTAPVTHP